MALYKSSTSGGFCNQCLEMPNSTRYVCVMGTSYLLKTDSEKLCSELPNWVLISPDSFVKWSD